MIRSRESFGSSRNVDECKAGKNYGSEHWDLCNRPVETNLVIYAEESEHENPNPCEKNVDEFRDG